MGSKLPPLKGFGKDRFRSGFWGFSCLDADMDPLYIRVVHPGRFTAQLLAEKCCLENDSHSLPQSRMVKFGVPNC